MDQTTEQIVTYATEFSAGSCSDSAKEAAVRHLVDTVVCMVVGTTSPAGKIAIELARLAPGAGRRATVVGSDVTCMPDMAAFASSVTLRAWDWQDGMYARGGGQPSHMIPAILAIAEVLDSPAEEVIEATILAYELLGSMGTILPLREMHWGKTTFMAPAAALAVGKLLKLDVDQLANAVAFSMCPGIETNLAIRQSVFSALLAKEGMTGGIDRSAGHKEPFEGRNGLWDNIRTSFGDRYERTPLHLPANTNGPMVVEMSYMKMHPAELHAQAVLDLVPDIRAFTPAEEIAAIDIEGYWHLVDSLGSTPGKWDPQDEKEAGLSMPFMLGVALTDGQLTPRSFAVERIRDPGLRPLMAKFTIHENTEFTENFRPPGMEITGNPRARVTVRATDGREFHQEVTFPKGHSLNPMSAKDIDQKMDIAWEGLVSEAKKEEIRSTWWNIGKAASISEAMRKIGGDALVH